MTLDEKGQDFSHGKASGKKSSLTECRYEYDLKIKTEMHAGSLIFDVNARTSASKVGGNKMNTITIRNNLKIKHKHTVSLVFEKSQDLN